MITLKGTRDGLLIQLGDGEWRAVLDDLATQVSKPQARSFFRGAQVAIDSGTRVLSAFQIQELSDLLAHYEMTLVVLTGSAEETRALAAELKLLPVMPPPEAAPEPSRHATLPTMERETVARPSELPQLFLYGGSLPVTEKPRVGRDGRAAPRKDDLGSEALMIRRTVRSGQVIRYEGHVVVFGDVNPGGEIIAGGDVIVWGRLRGEVHAGALGSDKAIVGALHLEPTQMRIGQHITRAPDEPKKKSGTAEVARVREGRIVVENWSKG